MIVFAIGIGFPDDDECITTEGLPGLCVSLQKCPPVLDLLSTPDKLIAYLRVSKCGFEGREPLVSVCMCITISAMHFYQLFDRHRYVAQKLPKKLK